MKRQSILKNLKATILGLNRQNLFLNLKNRERLFLNLAKFLKNVNDFIFSKILGYCSLQSCLKNFANYLVAIILGSISKWLILRTDRNLFKIFIETNKGSH